MQRDDACTCKTRGAPRTEQRLTLRFHGRLPVPGAVVASGACSQSHAQGALVFGGAPRTEQRVTLPLHGRVTVQEGAVQGVVLVAHFCRTARRCLHLQEWHDCAVQCTVAVAKPYRAAQRCVHLHSWHDSEVKSTVAVAKSCGAARRCVHLQDWHDKASWRWPNLTVQHDDACNFKIGTTARCKALRKTPCVRKNLASCNAA